MNGRPPCARPLTICNARQRRREFLPQRSGTSLPRAGVSGLPRHGVARLHVVVDTSSLIRAALNGASAAGRLIEVLTVQGGADRLVASADILHELAMVLDRPKFASRLPARQRRRFLLTVQAAAFFVSPSERVEACRDPADNIVLEAALAATEHATRRVLIVSDDRDLLTLDPWRGIRIAKPEAALNLLAEAPVADGNRGRPA